MENRFIVGITQGDVNSVAYELIIKLLAENRICELCTPVLYGSPKVAAYYRKALNVENFSLNTIREIAEVNTKRANIVNCVDDNVKVDLGKETAESDRVAMDSLKYALDQLDQKAIDVLLVSPQGCESFALESCGSLTDFLSKRYERPEAMSLLVNEHMKVGFVSECLKLREVPSHITIKNVLKKLEVLNESLKLDFSIQKPKIAVLGLNAQASCEKKGDEEMKVIVPAIEKARQNGIMAIGPFAADTFFAERMYEKFDAVLAMYYDQGLIPFKSLDENRGAAYVMGLPVVCAYSLHDTGYDVVGQNVTDEQGFRNALYLAMDVCACRKQNLALLENTLPHYDIAVNNNESDLNVEQIEGVKEEIDD